MYAVYAALGPTTSTPPRSKRRRSAGKGADPGAL